MPIVNFSSGVHHDCFALLDDCNASTAAPTSRLYTGYLGMLSCGHAPDLDRILEQMQQALRQGQHAIGVFTYEMGEQLHDIPPRSDMQEIAHVLLFEQCEFLSAAEVEAWLLEKADAAGDTSIVAHGPHAGIFQVRSSVTRDEFNTAIAAIQRYIEAGDTYQTNYTYRLSFNAYGSVYALYRRLRMRQPVPYGALIGLPDGRAVLSFSPELFVRHKNGKLVTRPMKGTAAATGNEQTDSTTALELASDPKNRAENLMIVDLLRNDLGRIAIPGSVEVPELFKVNRHGNVLQMTSTITAQLPDDVTLAQVFHALYPCGSITGAPKRRTMQIIRELETTPRGIYTGAIGWFDLPKHADALGDFCLSVPIRTLVLQSMRDNGLHTGEMGVGAGIVHDSKATDEYAECKLKAGFLTGLTPDFQLIETMYVTRAEGCRYLERHLARMRNSAKYFGFPFDEQEILAALSESVQELSSGEAHRLRLALDHAGACDIQIAPLAPLSGPVKVILADRPTLANDIFLRHKTTVRTRYDHAWRTAEAHGAFDMLFFNTRGELTEGGRSSVFVKLNGVWHTPPVTSGVLPGVMRSVLLADPAWNASERVLGLEDLRKAEQVVICNALRGARDATIDWQNSLTTK